LIYFVATSKWNFALHNNYMYIDPPAQRRPYRGPGTQVTVLISPRIRPQVDATLESDTKRVQALGLAMISALDATGLSMVAEVMDRRPHLDVWGVSAEKAPALQGAGMPEDRIHIQEKGLVGLRDVLATTQADDQMELAAVSAKSR
jgi:sulfate permease, SulP family